MSNGATPTHCLLVTDPARDAPQLVLTVPRESDIPHAECRRCVSRPSLPNSNARAWSRFRHEGRRRSKQ